MTENSYISDISYSPTASNASLDTNIPSYTLHPIFTITTDVSIKKRSLDNILLLLFHYHPNGILESQLTAFYYQCFNQLILVSNDLKHMLRTHRAITVTNTEGQDLLYTLNSSQLLRTLKLFHPVIINQYIIEKILRLFFLFPNGIACNCFDETFEKIYQFKLSHIISSWVSFVSSIPFITNFKFGDLYIFINTANVNTILQFDVTKIITKPVGYLKDSTLEHRSEKQFQIALHSETRDISLKTKYDTVLHKINKSPFPEDHYTVFMGGFPHGTQIKNIRTTLTAMGFTVTQCEMKYNKYGYSFVTLSSEKEAALLIQMSPIEMMGANIEVRPYINRAKQKNKKPRDEDILEMMIALLFDVQHSNQGVSIGDIQVMLYGTFSHRVSGSDLLEIVKRHSDTFCIKIDRIYYNYQ